MAAESECEIRFHFSFPFSMETIEARLCHAHANFRADGDLQNADRFSSSLYRIPLKSVAESESELRIPPRIHFGMKRTNSSSCHVDADAHRRLHAS